VEAPGAEIEELHLVEAGDATDDEHVLALEGTVHQPGGVRGVERVGDLLGDDHGAGWRQRATVGDHLGERPAFEELDDHAGELAGGGAHRRKLDDAGDGRMIELAGAGAVAEEGGHRLLVLGAARVEDLHRHALADQRVLGKIDRPGPTDAEGTEDPVPADRGADDRERTHGLDETLANAKSFAEIVGQGIQGHVRRGATARSRETR
jgi:hypothetical protein